MDMNFEAHGFTIQPVDPKEFQVSGSYFETSGVIKRSLLFSSGIYCIEVNSLIYIYIFSSFGNYARKLVASKRNYRKSLAISRLACEGLPSVVF